MAASLVRRVLFQQTNRCTRIVACRQYCKSPTGKDGSDFSKDPSTEKQKLPPTNTKTDLFIDSLNLKNEDVDSIKEEDLAPISLGSVDFQKLNNLSSSHNEKALNKFENLVEKFKKQKRQEEEEMMQIRQIQRLSDSGNDTDIFVEDDQPQESFATMLRKSQLVSLGDYDGRVLVAKIIEVMDDDLYIDFGGKFHCVCPRPRYKPEHYVRGTNVLITLKCLEMSSSFLGSDIHVTLLEADATLMSLYKSPKPSVYTADPVGGGGGGDRRPGDWTCPDSGCAAHNYSSRTDCYKCSTPKPEGAGDSGGVGGAGFGGSGAGKEVADQLP